MCQWLFTSSQYSLEIRKKSQLFGSSSKNSSRSNNKNNNNLDHWNENLIKRGNDTNRIVMKKSKALEGWKLGSKMASGEKGWKSHFFNYLRERGHTSLDAFLQRTRGRTCCQCGMSLLPFFNKDSHPPTPTHEICTHRTGTPCPLFSWVSLSWEPGSALGHTMHVYTALRSYFHSWAGSLGSWRGHTPCISCPWTRWQQDPRLARTGPSGKGLEATSSILGRGATRVLQQSLLCPWEQSPRWRFADLGESNVFQLSKGKDDIEQRDF